MRERTAEILNLLLLLHSDKEALTIAKLELPNYPEIGIVFFGNGNENRNGSRSRYGNGNGNGNEYKNGNGNEYKNGNGSGNGSRT